VKRRSSSGAVMGAIVRCSGVVAMNARGYPSVNGPRPLLGVTRRQERAPETALAAR
jgi:hypothetical protein